MESGDRPNRPNLNHNQVILQAKIREAQSGVEMIEFVIPLGMMELHCSCPIPDEGTTGSPVYVHMRPTRQPRDARNAATAQSPRPPSRRHNGGSDHGTEDENWGNRGVYGS